MQIQIYDLYSIRYGGQIYQHSNLSWIVNPKPKGFVLDSFFHQRSQVTLFASMKLVVSCSLTK